MSSQMGRHVYYNVVLHMRSVEWLCHLKWSWNIHRHVSLVFVISIRFRNHVFVLCKRCKGFKQYRYCLWTISSHRLGTSNISVENNRKLVPLQYQDFSVTGPFTSFETYVYTTTKTNLTFVNWSTAEAPVMCVIRRKACVTLWLLADNYAMWFWSTLLLGWYTRWKMMV
jgi:hypothetical protein